MDQLKEKDDIVYGCLLFTNLGSVLINCRIVFQDAEESFLSSDFPAKRLSLFLSCLNQFAPPTSQETFVEFSGFGVITLTHPELEGTRLALIVHPKAPTASILLKGKQLCHILSWLTGRKIAQLVQQDIASQEKKMNGYDADTVMTARGGDDDDPVTVEELEAFQEAYLKPLLQSAPLQHAWFSSLLPHIQCHPSLSNTTNTPVLQPHRSRSALVRQFSVEGAVVITIPDQQSGGQMPGKIALNLGGDHINAMGKVCMGESLPLWLQEVGADLQINNKAPSQKRKHPSRKGFDTLLAVCRVLKKAMSKPSLPTAMRGGGRFVPGGAIEKPTLLFSFKHRKETPKGDSDENYTINFRRFFYLSPLMLPDGFLVVSVLGNLADSPPVLRLSKEEVLGLQKNRLGEGLEIHPTACLPAVISKAILEVVKRVAHAFLEPESLIEMEGAQQIPPPLPLKPKLPTGTSGSRRTRIQRRGTSLTVSSEPLPIPTAERPPSQLQRMPGSDSFQESSISCSRFEESYSESMKASELRNSFGEQGDGPATCLPASNCEQTVPNSSSLFGHPLKPKPPGANAAGQLAENGMLSSDKAPTNCAETSPQNVQKKPPFHLSRLFRFKRRVER